MILASVAGVFAAKLAGIQRDDSAIFLPRNSESTQVMRAMRRFDPVPTEAAVVVYVRPAGITAADRAAVAADAAQFASVTGVAGAVAPAQASADGQALQVVVPIKRVKQADAATAVTGLRHVIEPRADGLQTYIAGQGALDADFAAVLKSVDVTLLATAGIVVIIILMLIYRSPVLWFAPVAAVMSGLALAQGGIYLLARYGGFGVDAQSASILLVLGFGAGTDYALLLISRLREELVHTADARTAVWQAWRRSAPAIVASGLTVVAALLCLLASSSQATRALGLTSAIAVVSCMIATLTFLPVVLALVGRRIFWPYVPALGRSAEPGRFWTRLAGRLDRRPGRAAVSSALVLVVLAFGVLQLHAGGIAQTDAFIGKVDATTGQEVLARHFPGGSGSPAVIVVNSAQAGEVTRAVAAVAGVARVDPLAGAQAGRVRILATLTDAADGEAALRTVERVRVAAHAVPGAAALVGGESAVYLDQQRANARDRNVVIPLVLILIFLVLLGLLRSLVAPLVLLATVVLSFLATLGVSAVVFDHLFHFAGADPSYPLFVFVFLVALGVDYNIFLVARIRDESAHAGTRSGTLRGLTVTGAVITSSGLVLAATFATLGILPLVFFATVGFSVGFGVLLDTLLVRSVLVPSLLLLTGDRFWWPGRLRRLPRPPDEPDNQVELPALAGDRP